MSRGIRVSEKHGVNPSLQQCFYCGEAMGVILFGKLKPKDGDRDPAAPRMVCLDKEPCNTCKKLMEQGVMLVSVRDGESGENPHRTGRLCVLREDAIRRIFASEFADTVCKSRFAFVEDKMWAMIGLPTEDAKNDGQDLRGRQVEG
jgi:hypothetical protein